MKRIESVEKIMEKAFDEKGINKFMSNININFVGNIDFLPIKDLKKKALSAIKRKYQALLKDCNTIDDVQKIINTIPKTGTEQRIEIQGFEGQSFVKSDNDYLSKLLYLVLKKQLNENLKKDYFENLKHLLPLIIKLTQFEEGQEQSKICLTLAKITVPPNVERGQHYLTGRFNESYAIKSLAAVMANMFLTSVVYEYTLKNSNLYELVLIEKYINKYYCKEDKTLTIPADKRYASIVTEQIEKFHKNLSIIEYKKLEDEHLNFIISKLRLEIVNNKITNLNNEEILTLMIKDFLIESEQVQVKSKRYHDNLTEYAKSFQEKKNILKEHQEVMKNNMFLKRFSEVELDNIVDLEKFREVEKEFIKLSAEMYIPNSIEAGISFRIKRIQHHKAAGLFYPKPIGCLIIDRDGISSFVHELGHLIDFEEHDYQLSETIDFKDVYNLYRKNLVEKVGDIKSYKKFKITGKPLSYYLEKAEVFARSFELYHSVIMGVNNSLLKTREEYLSRDEYPVQDQEYMQKVKEYFDRILNNKQISMVEQKVEKKKVISKALLPSTDVIVPMENVCGEIVQLSLFDGFIEDNLLMEN